MFCKKGAIKNFVKLTVKNLCWCIYFCRPATLSKMRLRHRCFSVNFAKFLKTFFLLNTSGELCKWISKLVTVYFISTFLVLVGIFMFIFGEHKLFFYIAIALWLRRYDVFGFSRDLTIEVSRNFLGGAPSTWFSTLTSFDLSRDLVIDASHDFVGGVPSPNWK